MEVRAIVDEIKKLTAVELAELVKSIEETFGVSAAAPAMMMGAAAPAAEAAKVEEKTHFKVTMEDAGSNAIGIIKALRAVLPGLGLKEAQEMSKSAPVMIKDSVSKDEAEAMKKALEEAGAKVKLS